MEYLGTIIVSLILLAIVAWIIRNMVKAKRQGKSASCSSCSSSADCHATDSCCARPPVPSETLDKQPDIK